MNSQILACPKCDHCGVVFGLNECAFCDEPFYVLDAAQLIKLHEALKILIGSAYESVDDTSGAAVRLPKPHEGKHFKW